MSATIIDGKAIAADTQLEIKARVSALAARGIHPGLAVILVGANPASHAYVSNKVKSCATVAMNTKLEK